MVPTTPLASELTRKLPTPIIEMPETHGSPLWIKNDGLTGERYGGNKLRKLAPLLALAKQRQRSHLLTVGAAGSHHVLATAIYGGEAGFRVSAVLVPQHHTPHAERVFRASLAQGVRVLPLEQVHGAKLALRQLLDKQSFRIGPGAMGNTGATGYSAAALELAAQVREQRLPSPQRIVVALGSGSTAAGLLVGLQRAKLECELVGVLVAPNPVARPMVLGQALALARAEGHGFSLSTAHRTLIVRSDAVGAGYGVPTPAGKRATEIAQTAGLALDPTYTAKAFAVALDLCRNADGTTLYWHTLSAAPMEPLLAQAPHLCDLPAELRSLLISTR